MFPLGESTLALDEEILQVLDAADAAKTTAQSACNAVSITAQQEPVSLANAVRAPKPAGQEGAPSVQEKDNGHSGGSKRPGWRADCKDLAQMLLFSEDSEETENAQANPEPPARTKRMPCQETSIGPQLGISSK